MAFRWLADGGPTLNAALVALWWFYRGSGPVLQRNPIAKKSYIPLAGGKMVMLRLHYVPGGNGSHDFGHRGGNRVTVTQRRGTGSTNVARRGCRDRRDSFLSGQKICHGSHGGIDLLKCAVVERGERNKT